MHLNIRKKKKTPTNLKHTEISKTARTFDDKYINLGSSYSENECFMIMCESEHVWNNHMFTLSKQICNASSRA